MPTRAPPQVGEHAQDDSPGTKEDPAKARLWRDLLWRNWAVNDKIAAMTESRPPIVSIIGQSGAGKTTFLTKLVAELKARHYRVATIKHHSHAGVEIDRPGKDTWRHFQAGADTVVMATPDRIAIFGRLPRDLTPDEAVSLLPEPVDLVLTEGYKRAGKPAIEVVRAAQGQGLVGEPGQLIALVTDLRFDLDLPHFHLDDAAGVAGFLERRFSLRPASEDTRPPEAR